MAETGREAVAEFEQWAEELPGKIAEGAEGLAYTVADAGANLTKGVVGLGEGVIDLGIYGASGLSYLFGDEYAGDALKNAAVFSIKDWAFSGVDNILDEKSWLGETGDMIFEGLGYTAGIMATAGIGGAAGLGATGITALTTGLTFTSSMGNGMTEAYLGGATDGEAVAYGFMKGLVDAGTEYIFAGMGKGVNALGYNKGLLPLDDWVAKKLSSKISSEFWQAATELGVKAVFEGSEEVLAGIGSAVAKKLTYMSEEDLGTLLNNEQLLDQFIMGTVISGIVQTGDFASTAHTGKQYVQGKKGKSIQQALDLGLSNPKSTETYQLAEKLAAKVQAGEKVSYYAVGRIVRESSTAEAQTARRIDSQVRQSAQGLNLNAETVDTVAAAAVALKQDVRFVDSSELVVTAADGSKTIASGKFDPNTGTVLLNAQARDDMLTGFILAHELTHSVEGTRQWKTLASTVKQLVGNTQWNTAVQEMQTARTHIGLNLTTDQAAREVLADWIGKNLFTSGFAQAVANGDAKAGGMVLNAIDRVRRAFGLKNNSLSARNIAMLERLFIQAINAKQKAKAKTTAVAGKISEKAKETAGQYAIVTLDNGKIYVIADRKILSGNNKEQWKQQIDTFFENVLDKNGSLTVDSIEGDTLTITKDETVWKGKDEHKQIRGLKRTLSKGEYRIKLSALSHIDELAETSVAQRNPDGTLKIEPDKKNHPFAKDGFEYRTVYFEDFDGKYYRIVLSVGLNNGVATVYNIGQIKETSAPQGNIISCIGSKAGSALVSDTTVPQSGTGVNTQSMQNEGKYSPNSILEGDWMRPEEVDSVMQRFSPASITNLINGSGTPASVTTTQPEADAAMERFSPASITNLINGSGGVTPSAVAQQTTTAATATAEPSTHPTVTAEQPTQAIQPQTNRAAFESSNSHTTGKQVATARDVDGIINELGDEEAFRRMYSAAQLDRPTGTVEVNGQEISADDYMAAVYRQLPNNEAELQQIIHQTQGSLQQELMKAFANGETTSSTALKINLQLFAAEAKLEYVLDGGEEGTKTRRFFENRLKGQDANQSHQQELNEFLAGRSETYNPISNQQTLETAKDKLRDTKYAKKLQQRILRDKPSDYFSTVDAAAAQILINDAKNAGDLDLYADLVQGLSRKGTELGRAVQILSMQARMTPEGTLRAAQRVLRKAVDTVAGKGTDEQLDSLSDMVTDAVERIAGEKARTVPSFEVDQGFENEINNWQNLNETAYIKVGKIPGGSPLHQVGVPAGTLYFDVSKLRKAMDDHNDHLSEDILKKIPELLQNPIAIVEYKPGTGTNTANVYGDLYYHGTPVTVGIVVTLGRDGAVISKIRTVHARRDFAKQITDDSILYLGENKNETDSWFQAQGQPVPMRGTIYGFIRSISHPFGNVNALTDGEQVDELAGRVQKNNDPYITGKEVRAILERAFEQAKDMPAHLRKMLQKDGTIADLAERIAEIHRNGHLSADATRHAFEQELGLPTLSGEEVGQLVELVNSMNRFEPGSQAHLDAMNDIYDFLGHRLPVTKLETWNAWRKLAMLFNPKTHLRNYVSNAVMYNVVNRADNAIAAWLESLFIKNESDRTKRLNWSRTEHGQSIQDEVDKATEEAVVRMKRGGKKYDIADSTLASHKLYFGNGAFRWLNSVSDFNSLWLERGDERFFKKAFRDALGQVMTARGMTEATTEVKELAYQKAADVTFRADNALAGMLSRFKNKYKALGTGMDIVIPFTKTPANIAVQTINHSPIGLMRGAWDLVAALKGAKNAKSATTIINEFSSGITGTALMAIGLLLGNLGLFNTGYGKSEKERAADELAGVQENAIVIGDWSFTLDWLQPAATPLIFGASIAQRLQEEGLEWDTVFGAVMDGTDSLFELTMLQSLYDVFGGYDAGVSGSLVSVGENAISQSIPTLLGQTARAIDPVQRKTKGDNPFQTALNQVLAKVPGLTYLLDPELDVWGDEVYRTGKADELGAGLNVLQQFVSPSNVKRATGDDEISEEILRLYEELEKGNASVIPTAITRDEARDHRLDYIEANRQLGEANRIAVEDFMLDNILYTVQEELANGRKRNVEKRYSQMTDDERRRVLSRIYRKAKEQFTEEDEDNKKTAEDRYWDDIIRRVQDGD